MFKKFFFHIEVLSEASIFLSIIRKEIFTLNDTETIYKNNDYLRNNHEILQEILFFENFGLQLQEESSKIATESNFE